jgi:hypothetical protein
MGCFVPIPAGLSLGERKSIAASTSIRATIATVDSIALALAGGWLSPNFGTIANF